MNCPNCGKPLERITYRGGYLNRDQWESERAGDWWCETCPSDGRGKSGAYFWDREIVQPTAPVGCTDANCKTCREEQRQLSEDAAIDRAVASRPAPVGEEPREIAWNAYRAGFLDGGTSPGGGTTFEHRVARAEAQASGYVNARADRFATRSLGASHPSQPRPNECPECHVAHGTHRFDCSLATPSASQPETGDDVINPPYTWTMTHEELVRDFVGTVYDVGLRGLNERERVIANDAARWANGLIQRALGASRSSVSSAEPLTLADYRSAAEYWEDQAKKHICYNCGQDVPVASVSSAEEAQNAVTRENDQWICDAETCGAVNYAVRVRCRICRKPRARTASLGEPTNG